MSFLKNSARRTTPSENLEKQPLVIDIIGKTYNTDQNL